MILSVNHATKKYVHILHIKNTQPNGPKSYLPLALVSSQSGSGADDLCSSQMIASGSDDCVLLANLWAVSGQSGPICYSWSCPRKKIGALVLWLAWGSTRPGAYDGEAAKECVTPVPSESGLLTYFRHSGVLHAPSRLRRSLTRHCAWVAIVLFVDFACSMPNHHESTWRAFYLYTVTSLRLPVAKLA